MKIQAILVLVLVMLGGNVVVSRDIDDCTLTCFQACLIGGEYSVFCLKECLRHCHVTEIEISDIINGIFSSR